MEKTVAKESEALAGQRKAVALARYRLHEQQMETSLQAMRSDKSRELLGRGRVGQVAVCHVGRFS